MKRDMDLIRSLLLTVEAANDAVLDDQPEIAGYRPPQVAHHVELLTDAGFMHAVFHRPLSGDLRAHRVTLTWEGHDFLETIRDPEIWTKTKSGAAKLGGWTVSMLGEIAKGYVRQKAAELGLPLA